MRELYTQQLTTMKTRLIQMGAMCEDAISCSVKGMLHGCSEDYFRLGTHWRPGI